MWARHRVGAGDECVQSPSVCAESWIHPLGRGGGGPVGLRWARGKIQRLFTCGRRLGDVITDSCRGVLRPSDLRMIEIVRWKSKWYSRNNRRLWCFREAAVIAVQVRVGSIDRAFLHGLTTRTDGLSVVFFPPSACKVCGEEFVSRTELHGQNCQKMPELAAQPALDRRDD